MTQFFVDFFCRSAKKTLQENLSVLCFGTFPVANRFMDKKGGFLSHNTEIFRKGTPLCCFRKFLVANKFMDKEGAINLFRRKFIVSQCRNCSQGNLLACQ